MCKLEHSLIFKAFQMLFKNGCITASFNFYDFTVFNCKTDRRIRCGSKRWGYRSVKNDHAIDASKSRHNIDLSCKHGQDRFQMIYHIQPEL